MVRQNAVTTRTRIDVLKEKGLIHEISHNYGEIADGNSITFRITNDMSERVIAIISTDHLANGTCTLEAYANPTIDSAGSAPTIGNMRQGASKTTNATYEHSAAYSGGTQKLDTILPGSTASGPSSASGGSKSSLIGSLIDPGETIIWEVTNQSNDTVYMAEEYKIAEVREEVISLP